MSSETQVRPTRKASSDNYFEAKHALQKHFSESNFSWLEVVEGAKPDSLQYVIHASNKEATVPIFAVELYHKGKLQPNYETDHARLIERSRMPEDLRFKMVTAQMATAALEAQIEAPKPKAPSL